MNALRTGQYSWLFAVTHSLHIYTDNIIHAIILVPPMSHTEDKC